METLVVRPEATQRDWASAQIGRELGGRWTLLGLLGVGGSSVVYEAAHRNGKRVAIKLLRPERACSDAQRRRFLREGHVANRVGHPAVVSIDDEGEAPDGAAYLVMERLEGETLDQLRERLGGRVPWPTVVELAGQLLDVLAIAHRRGIVHRDVKPSNLFVTPGGELRVLDFGFSRQLGADDAELSVTRDGAIVGTPAFMAPEQARASACTIGPRTDLWAVGATAFTLLTGRRVYEAATVEEQLALASVTEAPSLAEAVPELPPVVARAFQRALAYDPGARWESAEAMQAALREASPAPGASATPSGARRSRLRPLLGAVAALVMLGLAATLGRSSLEPKQPELVPGRGAPEPAAIGNTVVSPTPRPIVSIFEDAAPGPGLARGSNRRPLVPARTPPVQPKQAPSVSGIIEEPPF